MGQTKSRNLLGQQHHAISLDKKIMQPLRLKKNHATSWDKKKSRNLFGQNKRRNLWGQKKSRNLLRQKKSRNLLGLNFVFAISWDKESHATSWDKKITQPLGTK